MLLCDDVDKRMDIRNFEREVEKVKYPDKITRHEYGSIPFIVELIFRMMTLASATNRSHTTIHLTGIEDETLKNAQYAAELMEELGYSVKFHKGNWWKAARIECTNIPSH